MVRKNGDPDFDVTRGSVESTKLWNLAGLYILHTLGENYGNHRLGFYRSDWLSGFGYTKS